MIVPDVDRELIEAAARRAHLVVEEVAEETRGSSWTVTVVVDGADSDTEVDLDTLAALSRELDPLAEHWGPTDRTVVVQVASRGVDAPLTDPRHWLRARGRVVRVDYRPGAQGPDHGRVGAVDAAAGTVRLVRRQGRRPVAETIRLDEVAEAVVQVEFAPAPADELDILDTDGKQATRADRPAREQSGALSKETDR